MRPGLLIVLCGAVLAAQAPTTTTPDPTPQTLDEFRATAARVLQEAGVPGAGIALVRADGVEWEGGIGLADRDRGAPVTADTHFRVGSVSKTFVAIAVMRLYYDDKLLLDDTIEKLAPEIEIDNPWHDTDPVRVIHLLQHTAGFDDMHFNEIYNTGDPPDIALLDVLKRNPGSRRVRWRPGTRMSYSNPGYAIAGYLVEKLDNAPFEDFVEREILLPLQMHTSSFRLRPEHEPLLAQGYDGPQGPPTGFPQIYLRPAGNLHSSAREMARFVRMLLNWGELDGAFIVDPEYLGNMERSSTTRAALAGLRTTYGSGLYWDHSLPFPVVGHGGGIEGFVSTFGYSPARDVGYVILLNSDAPAAERALRRLSSLAIAYLKRDVEPPAKPVMAVDPAVLERYVGFYQDANPRNQLVWPVQRLFSGRSVYLEGNQLFMRSLGAEPTRLIPVSETTFRRDEDAAASIVFTHDAEGLPIMTGSQLYAERRSRWAVELQRLPVLAALAVLMTPLIVAIAWVARIRRGRHWSLKTLLLACPLTLAAAVLPLALVPIRQWGTQNAVTTLVFIATSALPLLAIAIGVVTYTSRRARAGRFLTLYAAIVAFAAAGVSAYLAAHGLIGLRLWAY